MNNYPHGVTDRDISPKVEYWECQYCLEIKPQTEYRCEGAHCESCLEKIESAAEETMQTYSNEKILSVALTGLPVAEVAEMSDEVARLIIGKCRHCARVQKLTI